MTVNYFQQANQQLKSGELKQAIASYQKAIEKNPNFAWYYQNLADALVQDGQIDEAIIAYQQSIHLKQDSPWSYYKLGKLLLEKGKIGQAIEYLQKAVDIQDDVAEFYLILGESYTKNGLLEKAEKVYQKAIEIDPKVSLLNENLLEKENLQQEKTNFKEINSFDLETRYSSESLQDRIRLIAYYLPQFHPIPENDLWWGKGFTEWTNVSRAKPLFEGHYQPHIPAELGFYDLRLPEVREAQAELAKKYGIYGFCYYYYWFAGKRLLNRPIDEVIASKKPDFPFCICWANENWTRRWDGLAHEILIAQDHSLEQNQAFAESIVHILRDERYIRINGAPLLIVYRSDILPDPIRTTELWRKIFKKEGVGEVHLAIAITCFSGMVNPTLFGFDSAVQFPPHGIPAKQLTPPETIVSDFSGHFYDYPDAVINAVADGMPDFKFFPGAMTSWDNTARRKSGAHAFLNFHPDWYELWLRGSIEKAKLCYSGDEQLVFINAWNEWAEGAHLEPDTKFGHSYLMATSRALEGNTGWKTILNLLKYFPYKTPDWINQYLNQLEQRIFSQDRSLKALAKIVESVGIIKEIISFSVPLGMHWNLESFPPGTDVYMTSIVFKGWIVNEKIPVKCIDILSRDRLVQRTPIDQERLDVAKIHSKIPGAENSGFLTKVKNPELKSNKEFQLQAVLEDNTCIPLAVILFKSGFQLLGIDNIEQTLLISENWQILLNMLRGVEIERDVYRWHLLEELEKNIQAKEDLIKLMSDFLGEFSSECLFD